MRNHGPSRQEEVTNCGDRCGGHRVGASLGLTSHWRVWAVSRRCAHLSAPVPLGLAAIAFARVAAWSMARGANDSCPRRGAARGHMVLPWIKATARARACVVFIWMRRARPGNLPPRPSASALHRDLSCLCHPSLPLQDNAADSGRSKPSCRGGPCCSRVQAWPQLNQGRNSSCIITGWNSVIV